MLWGIYWIVLIVSFIFGIIVTITKKNKIFGLLQSILSLILPIWSFIFALNRNYLTTSEIAFFVGKIISLNIEAIIILILYLVLFGE